MEFSALFPSQRLTSSRFDHFKTANYFSSNAYRFTAKIFHSTKTVVKFLDIFRCMCEKISKLKILDAPEMADKKFRMRERKIPK